MPETRRTKRALIKAAAAGHGNIVALLLENGADVAVKQHLGIDALMVAAFVGNGKIVQALVG